MLTNNDLPFNPKLLYPVPVTCIVPLFIATLFPEIPYTGYLVFVLSRESILPPFITTLSPMRPYAPDELTLIFPPFIIIVIFPSPIPTADAELSFVEPFIVPPFITSLAFCPPLIPYDVDPDVAIALIVPSFIITDEAP